MSALTLFEMPILSGECCHELNTWSYPNLPNQLNLALRPKNIHIAFYHQHVYHDKGYPLLSGIRGVLLDSFKEALEIRRRLGQY